MHFSYQVRTILSITIVVFSARVIVNPKLGQENALQLKNVSIFPLIFSFCVCVLGHFRISNRSSANRRGAEKSYFTAAKCLNGSTQWLYIPFLRGLELFKWNDDSPAVGLAVHLDMKTSLRCCWSLWDGVKPKLFFVGVIKTNAMSNWL